jgi:phosphoadenosine phosphosulfate reductase
VQVAIDRIREFEPVEGYYLAFSGGKDSVVIKALADMAGVKYDTHYSLTTVDPPELVQFIKTFPDVNIEYPKKTMWQLIVEKRMPPTRIARYCCSELKENGGDGRFTITGVRWAESVRRKLNRKMIEFDAYGSKSKKAEELRKIFLNSDNDEKRRMIESCVIKGKHILNPIVDWTDDDVWEFIKEYGIKYCGLYDEGMTRLGCVGCPMGGSKQMLEEFKMYPKFKASYLRAFKRMLDKRRTDGLQTEWETAEEVFNWWISNN